MRSLTLVAAAMLAVPATAQVRAVPTQPESEAGALRGVEVILINEGAAPVAAEGPRIIEVTAADGTRLVLERLPAPATTIAPGGFAKARYVPTGYAARPVTRPLPGAPLPDGVGAAWADGAPARARAVTDTAEREVEASAGTAAGFLDRFAPHEPTYGAFGFGDSGGKLQVSFAFQPIGGDGAFSHLRFAYTQTMFWRLDLPSGPFTHTTYSPEVYVERAVDPTATIGLGWRHDSNGEGPATSIDSNRIFLRATKRFDLGDGWRAEVTPQAWVYVGKQGVAPDLDRYWGNGSLGLALVKPDSLKLALTLRGSPDSGRGAAELFASWPLARLDDDLGFYLFAQGFTGYGEALDDHRRRDTHARIGIALTR
ncbi:MULTISPECIES: phospholipase A [unclassified Sphingomonas]|uniref:phospholipase A n=1 Tax=unclassified Sphingomonas TaxID=196159 RepID=UPI0021513ADF|nr:MULTISPECIES: phospholipase A [unclassified Sphingomonas]MCR5870342.1 phospholipase A [Sphingomonas sp. J344]UUX97974.1 phospholipase A [Sphingomonas sp. J315]